MNRAQNHNPSYLALITLISHMPHFEQILAESICQEKRYHSVPYLYYLSINLLTALIVYRDSIPFELLLTTQIFIALPIKIEGIGTIEIGNLKVNPVKYVPTFGQNLL